MKGNEAFSRQCLVILTLVVCLVVCLVACPGDIIEIQIIVVAYYCATILITAYFIYRIPLCVVYAIIEI